ncbi:MAG TPA: substrate-binding domain-containing protein [Caldilineaceae bacterium]|mgnify:CR=1 FL=1|nr:substrate-binding domain-containing protein [Caldilineaceae bacterium]
MSTQQHLSRRRFLQVTAIAGVGGALAACVAPGAAPSTGGGEAAAPAGELVELSYMTPDRELENRVKEVVINGFNAAMEEAGKPYRAVNVVGPATDNDIKTKLTLDAAAGTLPDIFGARPELLADFVAAGYLADLRSHLEAWSDWSQYPDVLKTFAEFDGKLIGIPGGGTFSFYYRKDVLEGAGISTEQPATWDDFYGVCGQISEKTDAIATGIPAATPWGGGTWGEAFQMIWLSFDGPIFEDGKWVVSSPNLLNAFKVYETISQNGWLTVDELLSPNPWEPIKYEGFPAGDVAIVTGGDWQWTFDWGPEGATPIEGLFEKVERWAFPAEDGNPFTFVDGGVGDVVAANTKSLDGAFEFLAYGQQPDVMCETIQIHIGGPIARKDFAEKCPSYADVVNGKMLQASQFLEKGRTFNFNQLGAAKISDGVGRATEDIITGVVTAEEAMAAFADAMTDALGEDMVMRA